MGARPRKVSILSPDLIIKDLEKYRQLALDCGASDALMIKASSLVVQERVRAKCSIPKCAEYGTNQHCPPYSMSAAETKEIVKDYTYALVIRVDVKPEYAAGAKIHECYIKGKIDEAGRYRLLGKEYKKVFFVVSEVESRAFYDGYYLALGFAAGSCKNVFCFKMDCQALGRGKGCRWPLRSRPSMEAVGFDVFSMATGLGWTMYPVGGRSEPEEVPACSLVGLVLIV